MPTKLRRVQVMLDPKHFDTLQALSKSTRLSMSRLAADVIEEAIPLLSRALAMLNDAAKLTEEAKTQLRRDLGKEERLVMRAQGQAYGALASAEAAIAKAARRGRAAGAPGGPRRLPKPRGRTPG
jgi:hypothetical protein